MSARIFNYEDDWENEILECPKCHWKGTFRLTTAGGLAKTQTLQKLSKDFPDEVCHQNENAANATNPEEKVSGQIERIDLLFVHRRRVTL
jgi:hypothetical protein